MAQSEDKDVVHYAQFLGLRNTVGAESFEPGDLEAALNVDITDALRARRRKGYSTALSAGSYHSLWSNGAVCLLVSGTSLMEVMPDFSVRSVRSGLTSGARMAYTDMGDRAFYSNGVETGVFRAGASRSWGIAVPTTQGNWSATGGSLRAGRYQYAVTYVRGDGQESGTGRAGVAVLNVAGGLSFSGLPVSPDSGVTEKRLYISPVDGDMMFLLGRLNASTTTFKYEVEQTGTTPLRTQFLSAPPAGSILATFAGRVLVAHDNRLYPSEPFSPELFDMRKGLPFPARVTLMAPMTDGLYLGTEVKVGWIAGKDPAQWEFALRADYGAIPGTLAYVTAEDVTEGAPGLAAMFATTHGICAGFDGGQFTNLTNDRFNYPAMDFGAGLVRDNGGSIQYLATLQGTEVAGNTAF